MAFDLSFSEEFFTGTENIEDIEPTDKPTNILQAIISLYHDDKEYFHEMVKEVLEIDMPDYLPESLPWNLLDKVRETNTCTDISSPVSVWIDSKGYYTIEVYEEV